MRADVAADEGRADEARALADRALVIRQREHGDEAQETANARVSVGRARFAAGDYEDSYLPLLF